MIINNHDYISCDIYKMLNLALYHNYIACAVQTLHLVMVLRKHTPTHVYIIV